VAEGTGLENRRTGNGFVSSNLTLSVTTRRLAPWGLDDSRGPSAEVCVGDELQGRVAEWFKAHAWKVCVR
jgi:hypothetical protein